MRYAFIGGYGRSGTTVAQLALARSPEVFPLMETQLFTQAVYPFLDGKLDRKQLEARYMDLVTVPKDMEFGGRRSKKNSPGVLDHFRRRSQWAFDTLEGKRPKRQRIAELVDILFGEQARLAGKAMVLEKSPRVITVAARLSRALPDAKFVHVHRDPRDVFCSVKDKNWGPNNVDQFIESYNKVMGEAWWQWREVSPENYLVVQMEDFVGNPRMSLGEISRFLGLDVGFVKDAAALVSLNDAHMGRWRYELDGVDASDIQKGCQEVYAKWRDLNVRMADAIG